MNLSPRENSKIEIMPKYFSILNVYIRYIKQPWQMDKHRTEFILEKLKNFENEGFIITNGPSKIDSTRIALLSQNIQGMKIYE